jgi:hypothetical protein
MTLEALDRRVYDPVVGRFVRLAVLGAVVAAVVAAFAVSSDASRSFVASGPLAVWQAGFALTLGRVDPATLLPRGKLVGLAQGDTPVLSPTGRKVAFSGYGAISVASAVPLRKPGRSIVLPRGSGHVVALAWPRTHRLLALTGRNGSAACCRTLRLYVVDPLKRRIVRSIHLRHGYVMAAKPIGTGLALLLGGYGRLASARLLLVAGSGVTRTVTLARFKIGSTKLGSGGVRVTQAALTAGSGSAYVLGRDGAASAVAVVPRAHGPAAYHTLLASTSLVQPDRGLVVLAGGRLGIASVTGLYVYDTHSWQQVGSVPWAFQNLHTAYISGESMIVLDSGSGGNVYNLDGSLRYHFDTPAQANAVLFVGGRGFLFYQDPNEDWGALNLASGTLHPPITGDIPGLIPGQPGVPAFAATPF